MDSISTSVSPSVSTLKRRGNNLNVFKDVWNNLQGFKDWYLKAKARIRPRLAYVCHIRSTADGQSLWVVRVGEDDGELQPHTYGTDDVPSVAALYYKADPGRPTVVFWHGNADQLGYASPRDCLCHRGSLIRNRPLPRDIHRALCIGLL